MKERTFVIPHPLWFAVVDVLVYVPSALTGAAGGASDVRSIRTAHRAG